MNELNLEHLDSFCDAWLRNADNIDIEPLDGVFDRFFTLWVVYNRLYEEAARFMLRDEHPIYTRFISRRGSRIFAPAPDRLSATKCVTLFCGHASLRHLIYENEAVFEGLQNVVNSIQWGEFYLHENYETGEPHIAKDRLVTDKAIRGDVESVLALIYQARCNLFHGQKSFTEPQRALINSLITILIEVITCLRGEISYRAQNA
ncbi:hypothetical protein BBM40_23880 [Vibrio parahaemolyticus]|uniref:hypothetical protein n=1 Tax=Vibrio parahaemolyticus TaxID=670 RepID=UPI00084A9ED5|nr:hypothetical protein [Vibrio parahaemolyticus]ODZ42834.1 hypothetical protein BBM40_23880 [Vibrio parahaemolyticus]